MQKGNSEGGRVRINVFLASAGLGSRRSVEQLVRAGLIVVNGVRVEDLSFRIHSSKDVVLCDGKPVVLKVHHYGMLHKPAGYACTRNDPHLKRTIYELLPKECQHLNYAGRLDVDSEGLVLLSNDGEWLNRIAHPRHEVPKVYEVEVDGVPSGEVLEKARSGVRSRGEWLKVEEIRFLSSHSGQSSSRLRLVLLEGKNREIRRIFDVLNHPVRRLVRLEVGGVKLGNLKAGEYRELKDQEVEGFR